MVPVDGAQQFFIPGHTNIILFFRKFISILNCHEYHYTASCFWIALHKEIQVVMHLYFVLPKRHLACPKVFLHTYLPEVRCNNSYHSPKATGYQFWKLCNSRSPALRQPNHVRSPVAAILHIDFAIRINHIIQSSAGPTMVRPNIGMRIALLALSIYIGPNVFAPVT